MRKKKQMIECGRCGEAQAEFLTSEEASKLRDAIAPIYRQCDRCQKTTGWISSTRQADGEGRTPRGHERLATQAERDKVDSLVNNRSLGGLKD